MRVQFSELAKVYGNAAQIASAILAVGALLGIYLQVQANLAETRNASAREFYRAYLHLAVQNPKLAQADYDTIRGVERADEFSRYGWFVSYLLYTCEQVLTQLPDDPEWRRTCVAQIGYHIRYICDHVIADELDHYNSPIRTLIKELAAQSTAAECKKA